MGGTHTALKQHAGKPRDGSAAQPSALLLRWPCVSGCMVFGCWVEFADLNSVYANHSHLKR